MTRVRKAMFGGKEFDCIDLLDDGTDDVGVHNWSMALKEEPLPSLGYDVSLHYPRFGDFDMFYDDPLIEGAVMSEWLTNSLVGDWQVDFAGSINFSFTHSEDAALFRLRWLNSENYFPCQ